MENGNLTAKIWYAHIKVASLQDFQKCVGEFVYLGLRFAPTQAELGRTFGPFGGAGEFEI